MTSRSDTEAQGGEYLVCLAQTVQQHAQLAYKGQIYCSTVKQIENVAEPSFYRFFGYYNLDRNRMTHTHLHHPQALSSAADQSYVC